MVSEPDPADPSGEPTLTPSQARGAVVVAPQPGGSLGRYELEGELGAGGMGVVYRGRDPALGRALAIKLVRPRRGGADARARLLREAQAMARLHHANVVPVFDVGTRGDQVFLVMPLLPGGTLGRWLRDERRPWRAVLERFLEAAQGLAAAHDAGLVHRDFKPENVLLGERGEVQVADFGLARVGDEDDGEGAPSQPSGPVDLTRTGEVVGTPAYMAPEQLRGEPLDPRADQFAFCVSLWEGLYGRRPFEVEPGQLDDAMHALHAQIAAGQVRPPPEGSGVPRWLDDIVRRGLRPEPANRWPSMAELVVAIERRLEATDGPDQRTVATLDMPVVSPPPDDVVAEPAPPAPRTRHWPWLVAAGAVVIAGAVAAVLLTRSGDAATPPDLATLDDDALGARCDHGDTAGCRALADRESRRLDGPPDFARMFTLLLHACDLDDAEACGELAGLYAQGRGVTADLARARELARASCEGGSASGCATHASQLATGIGGEVDSAGAVAAWRRACDGGVAGACRLLANRLRTGHGVSVDEAAADALETRAFALADTGCAANDTVACRVRGLMYHDSKAVPRDDGHALADLDRACRDGSASACGDAGQFFAMGIGVQLDLGRGLAILRRGCDGGDNGACENLVGMLAQPGPLQDPAEARRVAEALCDGHGDCGMLAFLYFNGTGVPQDLVRTEQLYERACTAGDPIGCWFIGRWRTAQGDLTAARFFDKSCEQGWPKGCEGLGDLAYARHDDATALREYEVTCAVSAGVACDKLGLLHFEGRGVPADPAQGRALYQKSCDLGSAGACNDLAVRLRDGDGLAVDARTAASLFEKACRAGWTYACKDGADLLSDGKALPADPARAAELRALAGTTP